MQDAAAALMLRGFSLEEKLQELQVLMELPDGTLLEVRPPLNSL